jgi:hypothetical protein
MLTLPCAKHGGVTWCSPTRFAVALLTRFSSSLTPSLTTTGAATMPSYQAHHACQLFPSGWRSIWGLEPVFHALRRLFPFAIRCVLFEVARNIFSCFPFQHLHQVIQRFCILAKIAGEPSRPFHDDNSATGDPCRYIHESLPVHFPAYCSHRPVGGAVQ